MYERKHRKSIRGTSARIRESLKKATAEMLFLQFLQNRPMYIYELTREIARVSDQKIVFDTLYQAAMRLKQFGYIEEDRKVVSEDNRIRIFFRITESGIKYLADLIQEYHSFTSVLDEIITATNCGK